MSGVWDIANYRGDPFDDNSINAVSKTEKVKIPSSSPYIVQLEEQPRQDDPSSFSGVDKGTDGTGGTVLTEVATDPQTNQFQVDYDYNTGLVKFNENQAGHIIEISYHGIGSPTFVKAVTAISEYGPADFGDGSDGSLDVLSNINLGGIKRYTSVNLPAGYTITVDGAYFLTLMVDGPCVIAGAINASGKGPACMRSATYYPHARAGKNGGAGGGYHHDDPDVWSAGGDALGPYPRHGGWVFHGESAPADNPGAVFDALSSKIPGWGASGANMLRDSNAGGGVLVVAKSIEFTGSITADAVEENYLRGGSSGGGVIILASPHVLLNTGSMSAAGGTKGDYAGGDGFTQVVDLSA